MPDRTKQKSQPLQTLDTRTWNSAEDIALHRAMSPQQRWRKAVSLSQAAQRLARAERVDER